MTSHKMLLIIILLFPALWLTAQVDSHYWTHQYGARGLLLNGAVIASAEGETSLFYNPGSIGIGDDLGFAFSFLSPTYSNLQVRNIIGDDNLIRDTGLGFSPGFLGIRFKPFKSERFVAGVTAFERFRTEISFEDRVVDRVNQGAERLFRGDLDFSRRISEDWYGLGLACLITDNVGIGITQFSIWHSQALDFRLNKEIVSSLSPSDVLLGWQREFGYNLSAQSGFVTKLGLRIRQDDWNLGLTLTSPTYGIIRSSARYTTDDLRINVANESFTNASNRNDVTLQDFRTPLSVGAGLDISLDKDNVLSISMEYFGQVGQYTIFEDIDDSFDGLASDSLTTISVLENSAQSVLNIAVGYYKKSSENVTWLFGARTDFNQNNNLRLNNTTEYLGTTGNVFHISGGGSFNYGRNQFSMGMDLAYGRRNNGSQIVDISDIDPDNFFLFNGRNNVSSRFFAVSLFVTYDFIFSRITSVK